MTVKADKRLGQHFLTDESVIDRLVYAIAPEKGQSIVEIGPGLGALTLPILTHCGGKNMIAIEFDRRVIPFLEAKAATLGSGRAENLNDSNDCAERSTHFPFTVIHNDILKVNFADLPLPAPLRIIGNLPYNLSSPILFHCLAQRAHIADMHFMLQKEVVDRLVAGAGEKAYGRLSIMAGLWCEPIALFNIPPDAFSPPPKVDSAVVRLIPRAAPAWDIDHLPTFERLIRHVFAARRKMIRKSLQNWLTSAELEALGIDPTARPETLAGSTFAKLSNALYRKEKNYE